MIQTLISPAEADWVDTSEMNEAEALAREMCAVPGYGASFDAIAGEERKVLLAMATIAIRRENEALERAAVACEELGADICADAIREMKVER